MEVVWRIGLLLPSLLLLLALAQCAVDAADPTTVPIAPGVEMPVLSLGTCCGSKPSAGLLSWLEAGGVGIDTANDYRDQDVIASILHPYLAKTGKKRSDFFITTKIPAGFGGPAACKADPAVAITTLKQNLEQLNVSYVDLVLLHKPCPTAAQNNALWKGLMTAKTEGLTRAIGVSNYKSAQLEALEGETPSVNQCLMSVSLHDDKTISYCQRNNITYEAYEAMRTCPFHNKKALAIAAAHNATVAQVCLRWIAQRGAVMAVGTGSNSSTAAEYAKENLGMFAFELTPAEMDTLDKM